jgi:hypothetical protein
MKKQMVCGKQVVFRYPRSSDLKDMIKTINALVEERVDIAKTTKVTLKEEKAWLDSVLRSIRKKEKVMIVVEVDGHSWVDAR